MTSTVAGPRTASSADPAPVPQAARASITWLDLLAGGSLLVVALVAWSSLALAHLGAHSLPAVLGVSAVALVVVLAACARRVRLRADAAGTAVALGCAVVALLLTYPGFEYGVSDKDPGGYVSHAISISRTGDFSLIDPVLATAGQDPTFPYQLATPGARFSGVWVRDVASGLIVPQFYHLWPALLATSYSVAGQAGLLATVPLMGVLSVLVLCALLRRVGSVLMGSAAAGLIAAGAGGLLLATNMLQVWQTRFPTTEVFAQALYLGALLGIVVALQTGWRPAAGFAGLFVGIGWLNRSDGFLLVLMSVGIGAALVATRRWDARATWFAGGLLVVLPHALLQAYDLARNYTEANPHLTLPLLGALVAALFIVAVAMRLLLAGPLGAAQRGLERRRPQVVVGALVLAGASALLAVGYLRPTLFGKDYFDYNDRSMLRSYDEEIISRLSWFISDWGFGLMLVGLAVVALRRWSASVWTVVLPTLVLFPVYGYTASNSTRLLWWSRRYIPTVLPGIVILLALALAFFAVYRFRGKLLTAVPAALALAGLLSFFLSQTLPLRQHDEWRGSFAVSQRIADLSGDRQGVFLWEFDQGCCAGPTRLFATPVWLQHGDLSVLLPSDAAMALDGNARSYVVDRYAERFADQPLFVVADKGELPQGLDPARFEPVDRFKVDLPMWEESNTSRPDEVRQIPLDIAVWRLRGT